MTINAWIRSAIVISLSALLAILLMLTSPMRRLDLWAGDLQARITASPRAFDDAVIVAIDDDSIARLKPIVGNWPYDRTLFAQVTDYLTRAGARAIVFDILFADERDGDAAFAEALHRAAPTTLAAVATPYALPGGDARGRRAVDAWPFQGVREGVRWWQDVELPLPQLTTGSRIGIANLVPDEDGVVRRIALMHEVGGVWMPALPFAAVFSGPAKPDVRVEPGEVRAGDRSWPIDRQGEVRVSFASTANAIAEVPFSQLASAAMNGQDDEQTRALFRDRTVFIGATALAIGPANETPMGPLPGVVLAAQTYAALQHDLVLRPTSWPRTTLVVLATLALPFLVRARRPDSIRLMVLGALAGLAAGWALNWLLFVVARQPTSLVLPMLVGAIAFVALLGEKIWVLRLVRQRLAGERIAAERTAALKQEFLVHVSHELRTPLTAIIGFSGMLADDGGLDPEKRTLAQVARRNAEQLLWQVNNLLDQARITAGQMLIDPVPTSIGDVLDHVMATLAGVPRRPGVELRCSGENRVPARVRIDGQRLQQILINLGANALKFTDQGSVHLQVDWDEGWLTTSIEDTGQGIPAEALERIFEPFAQSPSRARQSGAGTGLGLTISRNLARLMGGELTVTSTVGVGSIFRLRMPAPSVPVERPVPAVSLAPAVAIPANTSASVNAAIATADSVIAASPAVPAGTATTAATAATAATANASASAANVISAAARPATNGAIRAVVADDSEDIRIFLTVSLRRMGLEVSPVENGEAAVAQALADQPDIVLLDVQMPIMGGPEAAVALRRAGFSRLIIALTAGSGDKLESDLLANGFDAVVFKPVSGPHLASVINGLLTGQRDRSTPTPVAKAAGLT